MKVETYEPRTRVEWDAFIDRSKNGTFLFRRSYMDYHADRFEDASLVVRDGSRVVAVLPANRRGTELISHGGLTYGSFIIDSAMTTAGVLRVFEAARDYLSAAGVETVRYKTVPTIYHSVPADEDRYALFRMRAHLVRRDVLTVVVPSAALKYEERRRRGVKRAEAAGLVVRESTDYPQFWAILRENLLARHSVAPVHTEDEIARLHAAFPDHIRLFGAYLEDVLVGGVVVYESATVAHAQYIGSSPEGRDVRCLDLVFHVLITKVYANKAYFDFGVSTEDDGHVLNEGLIAQKEGFGGRAIVHDFYEWNLDTKTTVSGEAT